MMKNSAEILIGEYVGSLLGRDWEDSNLDQALRYRTKRFREIIKLGNAAEVPLIAILSHKDWAIRSDAAEMLGWIKSAAAVPHLISLMQSDPSRAVQASAALALDRIQSPEAVLALQEWGQTNGFASTRDRVLARIKSYLPHKMIEEPLLERLKDIAKQRSIKLDDLVMSLSQDRTQIEELRANAPAHSMVQTLVAMFDKGQLSEDELTYLEGTL